MKCQKCATRSGTRLLITLQAEEGDADEGESADGGDGVGGDGRGGPPLHGRELRGHPLSLARRIRESRWPAPPHVAVLPIGPGTQFKRKKLLEISFLFDTSLIYQLLNFFLI